MKLDLENHTRDPGWTLQPETHWADHAACRNHPKLTPDTWFITDTANEPAPDYVKAVCDRCPVKSQCLEAAYDTNEQHGVWGGLSAWERRQPKHGAA